MNAKLIFKISILVFGLAAVIFASKYFSSQPFQNSLDDVFQAGSQFQWCSTTNSKFKWLNPAIAKKTKSVAKNGLAEKYCFVQMESIQGIDIKIAKWDKLAQGLDSGGQVVYLEWDKGLQIFRAAGLPFKSSVLYKDLTD
ncbi:MAG: hypothetical protein H7235_10815 [Bdellovibrionaceae bacterium]|nr:hypothetical protein [Pseudobdellovibrionaceae bacterium]